MSNILPRRMPPASVELVEKNNALVRMNKAKAYRELQRRQGRYLHRIWTENIPLTQSYESAIKLKLLRNSSANLSQQNMVESAGVNQSNLFGKRRYAPLSSSYAENRPLSRERMTPATKCLYMDPGRPATAPETNPFATLDGPRQEDSWIIPKTQSERSNNSDSGSLDELKDTRQKTLRKLIDISVPSLSCNSNLAKNREESVGEVIQYPSASKMRELLANDGKITLESIVAAENGGRSIMKKVSRLGSARRRTSFDESHPASHKPANKSNTNIITSSIKRINTTLARKPSSNKQVSFMDSERDINGKTTSSANGVALPDEQQTLTLTTKNLNMFNAMVLKTIRTSKFDERIVQWVKERQCDQKLRLPKHEAIPEVDESFSDQSRTLNSKKDITKGSLHQNTHNNATDKAIDVRPTVLSQTKPETKVTKNIPPVTESDNGQVLDTSDKVLAEKLSLSSADSCKPT